MTRYILFFCKFVSTGFFISYIPTFVLRNRKNCGAGLFGSLLAFAFVPILPTSVGGYTLFLMLVIPFSMLTAHNAKFESGDFDDPRIVIDEMVGFWASIAFLPRNIYIWIICFVLFRYLDTVKPFFIKKFDRIKNGAGVVLDDLVAGVLVNFTVSIGFFVYANFLR
jgi:phosphatidylglycerophosphatase A